LTQRTAYQQIDPKAKQKRDCEDARQRVRNDLNWL